MLLLLELASCTRHSRSTRSLRRARRAASPASPAPSSRRSGRPPWRSSCASPYPPRRVGRRGRRPCARARRSPCSPARRSRRSRRRARPAAPPARRSTVMPQIGSIANSAAPGRTARATAASSRRCGARSMSRARIDSATSGGVLALMSMPAGTSMRASCSSGTPASRSSSTAPAPRFGLATSPTYGSPASTPARNASISPLPCAATTRPRSPSWMSAGSSPTATMSRSNSGPRRSSCAGDRLRADDVHARESAGTARGRPRSRRPRGRCSGR